MKTTCKHVVTQIKILFQKTWQKKKQDNMTQQDNLHKRFITLVNNPLVNIKSDERAQHWFNIIVKEYSAPHRHYHTLSHLIDLFQKFDKLQQDNITFKHAHIVELAIFFHDLYYDPSSKTNESDSAKTFLEFAALDTSLSQQDRDLVVAYINQTAQHLSCTTLDDMDELYFLDMDLSILGSHDAEAYDTYADNVRKEYSTIFNTEQFNKGRAAFLTKMSASNDQQQQHMFYTPYFRNNYETKAKENMLRELQKLQKL